MDGGEQVYKKIYIEEYCSQKIISYDGYLINFPLSVFEHAFFKSTSRRSQDKAIFCYERAERILWIKKALQDDNLNYYAGWDSKKKRYDHSRRVTLVTPDNYVVVLRITDKLNKRATFVTAYVIDTPNNVQKIKASPIWALK
ncbi:hypothetical protein ABQG68_09430 [Bacillus pumilus]|uniref:hypothetical protein n=1 Tax=Bacillus pumilus TaxID=1408 RepID=UPI00331614A6